MSRCASCDDRKGKRHCPALQDMICPPCCGEKRLREIACPEDCPYLKTGETYQKERRSEKALITGRDYLRERLAQFKDEGELTFALTLERTLHMLQRMQGRLTDDAVWQALEELPVHMGKVAVVLNAPHPLALRLAEKWKSGKEFEAFRNWPQDKVESLILAVKTLAEKRMSPDKSGSSYLDFIATYFGTMVSDADLMNETMSDPKDERPDGGATSGGILLP